MDSISTKAKDLYFEGLGYCTHCKRMDSNPKHRPRHPGFGLCDECMELFAIGSDKIERHEENIKRGRT